MVRLHIHSFWYGRLALSKARLEDGGILFPGSLGFVGCDHGQAPCQTEACLPVSYICFFFRQFSCSQAQENAEGLSEGDIKRIVLETLAAFKGQPPLTAQPNHGAEGLSLSELSDSSEEALVPSDFKRKYIAKDMLGDLLSYNRGNMGFLPLDEPGPSDKSVLQQFQKPSFAGLSLHQFVKDVIRPEWKGLGKIMLPKFIVKLYPLEDMESEFPDNVHVDSVVARLVGHPSMAEENILRDPADKKVDSALQKVFSGSYVALIAGIYGAYNAQSLITNFKAQFSAIQKGDDCYIIGRPEIASKIPF
ncbi:hypothetical protein NDU88_002976 [Pleurodeles waltl]|uniref:Uncharacterized protein n=1 Tax=Pleurodeles waltl TaxID=8319 RepID=A0AAV7MP86_PLEWA|nr:hypothetical protein NDU88_002976 [Pleurodeles waltl]